MNRFGNRSAEFRQRRPTGLDDRLARNHAVAVQRNFQVGHIDQIAEAKPLGLLDKRLVHDGELRDSFRNSREPFGISACGHDAHVFFWIDAELFERQAHAHI